MYIVIFLLTPAVVSSVMAVELEFSQNWSRQLFPREKLRFFLTPQLPPRSRRCSRRCHRRRQLNMPQTASARSTSSPSTKTDGKSLNSTIVSCRRCLRLRRRNRRRRRRCVVLSSSHAAAAAAAPPSSSCCVVVASAAAAAVAADITHLSKRDDDARKGTNHQDD